MVVVLGALVAVGALAGSVYFKQRQARAADEFRRHQLSTLAQAEEFYFNRFHRYGTLTELVSASLLNDLPRDPSSAQPYQVYFSSLRDEWCAWAKLGAVSESYLIQTGHQSYLNTRPPDSLANCKSP